MFPTEYRKQAVQRLPGESVSQQSRYLGGEAGVAAAAGVGLAVEAGLSVLFDSLDFDGAPSAALTGAASPTVRLKG